MGSEVDLLNCITSFLDCVHCLILKKEDAVGTEHVSLVRWRGGEEGLPTEMGLLERATLSHWSIKPLNQNPTQPAVHCNMLPTTQCYVGHGDIWNAKSCNPFSGKAKTQCEFEFTYILWIQNML